MSRVFTRPAKLWSKRRSSKPRASKEEWPSFMAVAFYSLLFGLSWGDVSLVAPASASLTFVANAFAAKLFLRERVDHRRWIAAMLVAGGVALMAL